MKNKLRSFSIFSLALILAISAVGIVPATPVRATAYVVNSLNDVDDTVCNGTHCSLREAINDALSAAAADTITFSVNGTIHLASTLPIITNDGALTIDGGNNITISGDTDSDNDGDVRILYIHPNGNLTLQNLTLDRGLMTTEGGGAILNSGTLTLNNVTISNSVTTAVAEGGGAIHNSGGGASLTLVNSTITGNTSTASGGAIFNIGGAVTITDSVLSGNSTTTGNGGFIYNSGPLTITGSTFSANQAPNGGGGAINEVTTSGTPSITSSTFFDNQADSGGAIHLSQGTLSISDSVFESNDAVNDAGAIYAAGSGILNVTNSTLSANTTASRGGGIFTFGNLTTTNVTISDNTAPAGWGGGIFNFAVWISKNTIVANSGVGGDCILDGSGSVHGTSSNNLIEDASNACGMTNNVNGNIVGSDALLGPLQNNGGATETHALLSGSPAIDKGTNTGCPNPDQRGTTRPLDGDNNGTATCDIGSFEYQTPPIVTNIVRADVNPTSAQSVDYTVTFSESVTGVNAGDFTLTQTSVTGSTVGTVVGSGTTYTVTVNLGYGAGTVRLDVTDNDSIISSANSVPLGGAGAGNGNFVSGESYTVNKSMIFRSVGTYDGWILESTEISVLGGTLNSTASTLRLGDDVANKQYRSILHFYTAGLPDTAVITKVTLQIKKQGLTGTDPFTVLGGLKVDIRKPFFGNGISLVASDFQASADMNNIGDIPNTPVSNWYTKIWSTDTFFSFIDLVGTTQFRLRFATDDNNNSADDHMRFFSGNHATTTDRPTLIIEYYVP